MVLGFWELPEEDQPSEELWGDDDALSAWFEYVKQRRKEKYGGGDTDTEVPQTQNEYVKEMLGGDHRR